MHSSVKKNDDVYYLRVVYIIKVKVGIGDIYTYCKRVYRNNSLYLCLIIIVCGSAAVCDSVQ